MFLLNMFQSNLNVTLKSKKDLPGFNNNNNHTINISCKKNDNLYIIIQNFNNFRRPSSQLNYFNINGQVFNLNQLKNIQVNRNMTIFIN